MNRSFVVICHFSHYDASFIANYHVSDTIFDICTLLLVVVHMIYSDQLVTITKMSDLHKALDVELAIHRRRGEMMGGLWCNIRRRHKCRAGHPRIRAL